MGRLILIVLFAIAAGWSFSHYHSLERADPELARRSKRAGTLVEPLILPFFVLVLLVTVWLLGGKAATTEVGRIFLMVFLTISGYYMVLLCLLPVLRRFITARACAALWIIPDFLYLTANLENLGSVEPRLLIPLPPKPIRETLMLVWLAGFVGVLVWQMISHLRFRRELLGSAEPVGETQTRKIWERERVNAGIKNPISLFCSGRITTPVTVGCFLSTIVTVLPCREYTEEELTLIFRHELEHIRRADMRTKVFLGFCTAICWFNPLIWLARKKVSEDLELSCDESVLNGEGEATRRQYAELLLRTAGDSRGFSTCLSASAAGLRYRLKNVVSPKKKWAGSVCVAVALMALLLTGSVMAFTEPVGTIGEQIFSQYPDGTAIQRMTIDNLPDRYSPHRAVEGWREKELMDYLSTVQVRRVYSEGYEIAQDRDRQLFVVFEESAWPTLTYLTVSDEVLFSNIPGDGEGSIPYLVESGIDWDYVLSLLEYDRSNGYPARDVWD